MPNIKPLSDLCNYDALLNDVVIGNPLFLTSEGYGKYVLMDIDEYNKSKATLTLLSELADGEISARDNSCISVEEAERRLGLN